MTVTFQNIARTVTTVEMVHGCRLLTLSGPKADFHALEKLVQPGAFDVYNSRMRHIGRLIEKQDGRIVEAA